METIDYQSYTVEELRLIAPYDPEAEAELRRREEASPDAAPPEPAPAAEPTAPPEPGDAAAAYAETMALLHAAQQHELNRRWREESDPYAGLAYAAKLLRESDSVSERTAAMDMLLQLEVVFMEQLSEQTAAPRLALRDVQLALAGGYRSGVRATGESDALPELAFRRYENAYELDPGCVGTLAWCWQTGYGTRKDPKRAAQLLEAAHDGSAASWKRLGDAYALLGWNAKAEECRAAAQQQEKRRRRSLRQRVSKRTLRIIAGVLAVLVAGELAAYSVLNGRENTSAPVETAGAEDQSGFLTHSGEYYGLLEYEDGRTYRADAEFLKDENDERIVTIELRKVTGEGISDSVNNTIYGTLVNDTVLSCQAVGELKTEDQDWSEELNFVGKLYDKKCTLTLSIDGSLIGERLSYCINSYNLFRNGQCEADSGMNVEETSTQRFEGDVCVNGVSIQDSMSPIGEASVVIQLDGTKKRLTFETRALEERGGRGRGDYQIWRDGVMVPAEEIQGDSSEKTVDITGVREIKIVLISENGGANGNSDHGLVNLFVYEY